MFRWKLHLAAALAICLSALIVGLSASARADDSATTTTTTDSTSTTATVTTTDSTTDTTPTDTSSTSPDITVPTLSPTGALSTTTVPDGSEQTMSGEGEAIDPPSLGVDSDLRRSGHSHNAAAFREHIADLVKRCYWGQRFGLYVAQDVTEGGIISLARISGDGLCNYEQQISIRFGIVQLHLGVFLDGNPNAFVALPDAAWGPTDQKTTPDPHNPSGCIMICSFSSPTDTSYEVPLLACDETYDWEADVTGSLTYGKGRSAKSIPLNETVAGHSSPVRCIYEES